jgi:hypothetical protein
VRDLSDELEIGNWRTPRQQAERRQIDELFAGYEDAIELEQDALQDAYQDWRDRRDDEDLAKAAERMQAAGIGLVAATHPDELERIAAAWPDQDARTPRNLRVQARRRRSTSTVKSLVVIDVPRTTPRARQRREQRHRARSSSSADSGDGEPGPGEPASDQVVGLAVCPLCGGEAMIRARCGLCHGLGVVERELRNAWKRGWRP